MNRSERIERPKEKIPLYKGAMMVAFAAIIDILKFIFSIFIFIIPLIIGTVAGGEASKYVGVTLGAFVGTVTAWFVGFFETATGAAVGIATAGEFFAIIVGFLGWGILLLWLLLSGISIIDVKSPSGLKRTRAIFGSGIFDLIPIINIGTWLTATVIYIVRTERKDYKKQLLEYEELLNKARVQKETQQDAARTFMLEQQAQTQT